MVSLSGLAYPIPEFLSDLLVTNQMKILMIMIGYAFSVSFTYGDY